MSAKGDNGKKRPRKRSYENIVCVDLGDLQAKQLAEMQDEILRRDGMDVSKSDLIRRCVAYAWRHARLKAWGPP